MLSIFTTTYMQKFTLNLSSSNDINAHLPNNHESEDINNL